MIVTVGGSGVGEALLRRVIASYPEASRRVNGLRMIAVAGPRIDPDSLDAPDDSRSGPHANPSKAAVRRVAILTSGAKFDMLPFDGRAR